MAPRRLDRSRLLRLALLVATVGLLVAFALKVDWAATGAAIGRASWPMLAAAALANLASQVLKGLRWWVFLRAVGARSARLAVRAALAGAGLNNLLVANGGDVARALFVARAARVSSERVVGTLALDRLFELVGYVVLLSLAALFLELPPALASAKVGALVALAGSVALLVWLLRRPGSAPATEPVSQAPDADTPTAPRSARLRRWFARLGGTVAGISTPSRFAVALALSVAVWVLQVATYHLTAVAAGLELPLVGTIAALLAVNLGFALRATPGNVGVFQLLYASTAAAFGLDRDLALATALLIQTQQILPVTGLGLALAPEFIVRRPAASASAD